MAKMKTCSLCGNKTYNLHTSNPIKLCNKCYYKKRFREKGHSEREKEYNRGFCRKYMIEKTYDISYEEYKKLTKKCRVCNFDKVIQLHHIDKNHKNNLKENLIGLCPNHHRMAHHRIYQQQIKTIIMQRK